MPNVTIELGDNKSNFLTQLKEQGVDKPIKSFKLISLVDSDDYFFDVKNPQYITGMERLAVVTGETTVGPLSIALDLERGSHTLSRDVFVGFKLELEVEV